MDWFQIALLVLAAVAIVKIGRFLGPRVDRVIDRHVRFIDTLEQSVLKIDGKVDSHGERLDRIEEALPGVCALKHA